MQARSKGRHAASCATCALLQCPDLGMIDRALRDLSGRAALILDGCCEPGVNGGGTSRLHSGD
jgi:hypothetical protein